MLSILPLLIILGIAWYFLRGYIAEPFQTMIIVIIVIVFVLWLLRAAGVA